jgi:hypothetical protein
MGWRIRAMVITEFAVVTQIDRSVYLGWLDECRLTVTIIQFFEEEVKGRA